MQTRPAAAVDPALDDALDRLADKMNVGETQEAARDKQRSTPKKPAKPRTSKFYSRFTEDEARAAAAEAGRRYP